MPRANAFGNTGILRGIGGRGADDKVLPEWVAIQKEIRPFGA